MIAAADYNQVSYENVDRDLHSAALVIPGVAELVTVPRTGTTQHVLIWKL